MSEDKPLVYVVAAERSGDLLGAGLIKALRQKCGTDIAFRGMGGDAMAEEGDDYDYEDDFEEFEEEDEAVPEVRHCPL